MTQNKTHLVAVVSVFQGFMDFGNDINVDHIDLIKDWHEYTSSELEDLRSRIQFYNQTRHKLVKPGEIFPDFLKIIEYQEPQTLDSLLAVTDEMFEKEKEKERLRKLKQEERLKNQKEKALERKRKQLEKLKKELEED